MLTSEHTPEVAQHTAFYNSPKGRKIIARGEAPGKYHNVTSPEGVTEKDSLHTMDT